MPASMAGSRGGTIGRSQDTEWLAFVRRLLSGDIGYAELAERLLNERGPRTVTLVINNACNLRCKHCYLQVERLSAPVLREAEWCRVIESLDRVEPELVCLSGKEVFINSLGTALLQNLADQRARSKASYRTGVITNGTLISPHRKAIVAAAPSYFDISLDGIGEDHDAVRGSGAFARAWPNILWAAETFGERFFVNLTVQRQNHLRILESLRLLGAAGVRNVELGFYIPLPYTSQALALSRPQIEAIFTQLERLASLEMSSPLTVHLDLDTLTFEPLLAFLRSRWFFPNALQEDAKGELFVEHCFPNGVNLEARLAPFPVGISRSVRITPEGNYLAAEDTVDTRFYSECSLGNVRDFGFDLALLDAHSRRSARLARLLCRYYEEHLPKLITAYSEALAQPAPQPLARVAA